MVETHSALRITVSTFGVLAGLAGIEHGIGEVLQGSKAPAGLTIESWPDAASFRVLDGEPAMTIVPNLLATGILAILVSLVFVVWATRFVEREHGGLILMLLSVVWLLVGGGFGPPLLGIILGLTATRMNASPARRHAPQPAGTRSFPANLWPWCFGASLAAWLLLFPGVVIMAYLTGADETSTLFGTFVAVLMLTAFGSLLLTIVAGLAHDNERQAETRQLPVM